MFYQTDRIGKDLLLDIVANRMVLTSISDGLVESDETLKLVMKDKSHFVANKKELKEPNLLIHNMKTNQAMRNETRDVNYSFDEFLTTTRNIVKSLGRVC
jgi:hypothetical protein